MPPTCPLYLCFSFYIHSFFILQFVISNPVLFIVCLFAFLKKGHTKPVLLFLGFVFKFILLVRNSKRIFVRCSDFKRYKLLTLLTLFIGFKLFKLLDTAKTIACMPICTEG